MRRAHQCCRLAVLTVGLVALAGCGRYYWSKPAGTLDDFNRDSAACARQASPAYGLIIEETYRSCLRSKGWSRAQQLEPVPAGWYRGIE
jgi:hypothetical protein